MKRFFAPVALVAATVVVVSATMFTGGTDARWAQAATLDIGNVDLTVEIPEDETSFDLRAAMSANRTVVPGRGHTPDTFPAVVEYTATVTNRGPQDATDITMTVLVPIVAGLDVVNVEADAGLVCDASQVASAQVDAPDHGLVLCTAAGPLAADSSYAVVITMVAHAPVPTSEFVATTTVSSPKETGPETNNTASWLISSPNALVDLSLHKVGPASIQAGKIGTYTLTVTNEQIGTEVSVAAPPILVDVLPAGMTFLSNTVVGSSTPGWCTAEGQAITCDFGAPGGPGAIGSGTSVEISLCVRFDESLAGTTVTNSATVFGAPNGVIDPSLENNTSTAITVVTAGSGNETFVRCPEGETYDMFAGGCVLPPEPGAGEPGPTPFDINETPPWTFKTVQPNGQWHPTPMTITVPFEDGDDHAVITIALGSTWSNYIAATGPNRLGQLNVVDKNKGPAWKADLYVNGTVVAPNPDGTYTVVMPVVGAGTVDIPIVLQVSFDGQGNLDTVVTPTLMAAYIVVYDAAGVPTWQANGGTKVPGYTKGMVPPPEPAEGWWTTEGFPCIEDEGLEPPQMAPEPAVKKNESDDEDAEGLVDPDEQVQEPVDEPDLVEATLDLDAMTFTLDGMTVLVVVLVEEVDGFTVVTTDDGTQFVQGSDWPTTTWQRVEAS